MTGNWNLIPVEKKIIFSFTNKSLTAGLQTEGAGDAFLK
jgi:hypothetical protein